MKWRRSGLKERKGVNYTTASSWGQNCLTAAKVLPRDCRGCVIERRFSSCKSAIEEGSSMTMLHHTPPGIKQTLQRFRECFMVMVFRGNSGHANGNRLDISCYGSRESPTMHPRCKPREPSARDRRPHLFEIQLHSHLPENYGTPPNTVEMTNPRQWEVTQQRLRQTKGSALYYDKDTSEEIKGLNLLSES